jgi:hypothetical protein
MTPLLSLTLFVSIVVCGITGSLGTHYPSVYYLKVRCGQTILVHGDVRLMLASTRYLPKDTTCSIGFEKTSGKEITATFLAYHITPAYARETGACPIESIQLEDANGIARLVSSTGEYCSKERPTANFFLGTSGQLSFTTGLYDNILTANVDLLISELSLKSSFVNSTCPSTDFDCGNGYCVSSELTCNGFDDCGNNGDEADCTSTLSLIAIAGIVGGLAFLVFVIVVLCIVIRRNKRRSSYTQHK